MKIKSFPRFRSMNDIFDRFHKVSSKIVFENREYKYVNVVFKGNMKNLIYRNEQEQHNLVISMMGDVVVHVEGIYSIGEVNLNVMPALSS